MSTKQITARCQLQQTMSSRSSPLAPVLVLLMMLSGCVTYNQRMSSFEQNLSTGNLQPALTDLDKQTNGDKKSAILFDLNRSLILRLQREFDLSNQSLERAKSALQPLLAISLSEQTLASAINDQQRTYLPHGFEQIYIHVFKILNYVALNDLPAARVEVLQMDVTLNRLNEKNPIPAQNAFPRYLSGVVFEMAAEWDQALIAYRKALISFQESQQSPPKFLILDMLRLMDHLGLHAERARLQKRYAVTVWTTQKIYQQQGQLLLLIAEGLAPIREEAAIQAVDPKDGELYRISIPRHQNRLNLTRTPRFQVSQTQYSSDLLANMNSIAEQTLTHQIPAITARAVARVAVKHRVVKESTQEAPILGLIANVATVASERADTRTWASLPSGWWAVKIPLEAGEYQVRPLFASQTQTVPIRISPGDFRLMVYHRLGTNTIFGL
ncbi:MAG TPA: hypothetical protein DCZ03_10000 [Gammaproteobacteria bacterium]|nr:hypothetical protein [Gammaproteobacteria bacterium]